jgi:hypothetical protein
MELYNDDSELYMLCTMVAIGLLSAHPLLVGAARRLVPAELCERLTHSLRQCHTHPEMEVQHAGDMLAQRRQWERDSCCSQARRWMHYSYPYSCRACLVHCTAIYCLVANDPLFADDAVSRCRGAQLQGLLLSAPGVQLDCALEVVAAEGQGGTGGIGGIGGIGGTGGTGVSGGAGQMGSDEAASTKQKMLSSGVFQGKAGAGAEGGRGNQMRDCRTLVRGVFEGAVRNVEYMAHMTRGEKDHIMRTLFTAFDVDESTHLLV